MQFFNIFYVGHLQKLYVYVIIKPDNLQTIVFEEEDDPNTLTILV